MVRPGTAPVCPATSGRRYSRAWRFLTELRRAFPFAIRRLQCDNGREFSFEFALAVEAAGIRHRYIRPQRRPAKRQGAAQPPDRPRGVLESASLCRLRDHRDRAPLVGDPVQLSPPLDRAEWLDARGEARGPPRAAGRLTCPPPRCPTARGSVSPQPVNLD